MEQATHLKESEKDGAIRLILNTTLTELMAHVGADCGSLFLFDPHRETLVLEAFYNSQSLPLVGITKRIGEGIAGKVASSATPILVRDLDTDARFTTNGFEHYRSKSFISLPLFSAGHLLCIINLADKKSGDPFDEDDLKLALTITQYASLSIDALCDRLAVQKQKEDLDTQKLILEKYASVGKLAAGIVHEINNPLDGIIRYTNMLLEQLDKHATGREYLLEVKSGLHRIASITRSLLEFSQVINATTSPHRRYVRLDVLIDESLALLAAHTGPQVHIQKKYTPPLPEILDLGLQHVALNIIKNALDAMPEGGMLEISVSRRETDIEVSFKDTGYGIHDEFKTRIFEPFFTTKNATKGTGLGLAICQEIINKYDGRIAVTSAIGQGSTFTVSLPSTHLKDA